MIRVAIVSKPHKEELGRILPELVAWLRKHGYEPLLDREGGEFCPDAPAVDRARLPRASAQAGHRAGRRRNAARRGAHFCRDGHADSGGESWIPGLPDGDSAGDLYATLEGWCNDCHTLDARAMLHAVVMARGAEHVYITKH